MKLNGKEVTPEVLRAIYDEFMEKYHKEHSLCPKCKGKACKTTLVGYTFNYNNPESYKDLNKCTCLECGDKHLKHDRISK